MPSIVLSKKLTRFKVGEDVVVTKENSENFNRYGVVWKVRTYNERHKIYVSFDGDIFSYHPEDLDMA